MKILLLIALVLLAYLFIRNYKRFSKNQEIRSVPRVGNDISVLIEEAMDLSEQGTAMPFQIFQLSGKFAPLPNKDEVIEAIDYIYNVDGGKFGFGRRVSLTTLRFIGAFPYSPAAQHTVEYLILRGLEDDAVWVRYDAAWVAALLKITNPDIISKLQTLQTELSAKDIEKDSAEDKFRNRVNEFFQ